MPRTRHYMTRKPSALTKPPLTHFLCLPLITPASKSQFEASLEAFQEAVTSDEPEEPSAGNEQTPGPEVATLRIHPKAIRPVGALHCTLGVMSLTSEQLGDAVRLLHSLDDPQAADQDQEVDSQTAPPDSTKQPLKIDLRGLVSMHPPTNTSILYSAPADSTGRLLPICLNLQKLFNDHNLLVDDDRELKLHATIVNTIYAKSKSRRLPSRASGPASAQDDRSHGHGPNANVSLKFDATAILEKFNDFVFAESVVLDRVTICEMGAKKIMDSNGRVVAEEYTEVAMVKLPLR